MYQTLILIPDRVAGLPMFGFGLLFGVWAVASGAILLWMTAKHGFNAETRSYLPSLLLSGAAIVFLLPLMVIDGGLPIRGYGVMLLLAVASGVGLAAYRARRMGLDPELIFSLAMWLFVSGIVGARLFYVIEYWQEKFHRDTIYQTVAAILNFPEGGLVVYGSLLAGGLALLIFTRRHRLPTLALCDLVVPSVVLGMAIGRIGCLLNGCCYGGACERPWAVQFPWGTLPHRDQVTRDKIGLLGLHFDIDANGKAEPIIKAVDPGSPAERAGLRVRERVLGVGRQQVESVAQTEVILLEDAIPGKPLQIFTSGHSKGVELAVPNPLPRSLPIHPTQIYSAIDALLLCGFLLAYSPYRRRDGELIALALTLHPISRYLIEEIRIDEMGQWGTHLSISQWISMGLLAVAVLVWLVVLLRPRGTIWPKMPATVAASL